MTPRLSLLVEVPSHEHPVKSIQRLRSEGIEVVVVTDDHHMEFPPDVIKVAKGSGALDRALSLASAPLVAIADPGGIVNARGVDALLAAAYDDEGTGVVYSDERVAGVEVRKPDWSPMFLRHFNYLGRLTLLPRTLVMAAGGFGEGSTADAVHRLMIRIADAGVPVRHVAEIVYERLRPEPPCLLPGPTIRSSPSFPVSVLLPTAGTRAWDQRDPPWLVLRALDTVRRAVMDMDVEVLCPVGPEADPGVVAALRAIDDRFVRVLHDDRSFNFSRRMNLAAAASRGEVLVWMNDDVERHTSDEWLATIVDLAATEGIGGVGLKLLYPDDTVQTVGVRFRAGLPKHVGVGALPQKAGPLRAFITAREQSAVTGAVFATRRRVYDDVGGLTEMLPINFGDIDYCLKVRSRGYRIVLTPAVTLCHHESASRPPGVVAPEEFAELEHRWGDVRDPYWPWPDEYDEHPSTMTNGSRAITRPLLNR